MPLPHDQNVVKVFVDGLFLGIYFVTFVKTMRWLLWTDEGWKRRLKVDWIILALSVIIFGCTTTNITLLVKNTMTAVMKPPDAPATSTIGSVDAPTWVDIVDCTNANVPTLLADAVLLYRLWLIYDKCYRVVVFPIFLWLGAFVCTILQAYWQTLQARGIPTTWQPVDMTLGPGIILTPFWGSTMVLNIYATFMMVRRIWSITKATEGVASTRSLRFLMRVFIESGSIYIIVTTSHFIVWWTPNAYAISLIASMNTPMTGFAFNLIIIRTYEKRAQEMQEVIYRQHTSTIQFSANAPSLKTTGLYSQESSVTEADIA